MMQSARDGIRAIHDGGAMLGSKTWDVMTRSLPPPGPWFAASPAARCPVCAGVSQNLSAAFRSSAAMLAQTLLTTSQFPAMAQSTVTTLADTLHPGRISVVVPEMGGMWRVFVSSESQASQDLLIAAERYPELLEVRRTGAPFLAPVIADSPPLAEHHPVLAAAGIQGLAAFPVWTPPGSADPLILKLASRRPLGDQDLAFAILAAHLLVHRLESLPPVTVFRHLLPIRAPVDETAGGFLLHQLPLGAVLVDRDGRILESNARAEWLTRALGPETGRAPTLRLNPPQPWEHSSSRWEATLVTDSQPTPVLGWSRTDRDGRTLVLLEPHPEAKRRDRERQIQQSLSLKIQELAEANVRLEEYAALRSRFVSDAAHELKTPLAILRSYLETLASDLSSGLTPEQEEFLRAATVGAVRLQSLVEALLDLAALEAGHAPLDLRPIEARRVIDDVVQEMLPAARDAGIGLRTLDSPETLVLRADPDRLGQVLRNLVDNGIKYTGRGGQVAISCHHHGERALLVVEDTGIGVAADMLPTIFEEFVRGAGQESARGAGLGLAIVRRLVLAMGGRVWAESQERRGSRFSVELPIWVVDT